MRRVNNTELYERVEANLLTSLALDPNHESGLRKLPHADGHLYLSSGSTWRYQVKSDGERRNLSAPHIVFRLTHGRWAWQKEAKPKGVPLSELSDEALLKAYGFVMEECKARRIDPVKRVKIEVIEREVYL